MTDRLLATVTVAEEARALVSTADRLAIGTVLAWTLMLALLLPPLWRIIRRRPRYLDALWAVLLLGVVNRMVSDFARVPPALQHLSAIIIALLLAAAIRGYQHADR